MKKIHRSFLIVLAGIIVLCLPYWIDDFACNNYKKDIEDIVSSVDEIKVLDVFNGCGNVANGDHTGLIVTVLAKTNLSKKELKFKFPDTYNIIPFDDFLDETKTKKRFSKLVTDNTKEHFVLVYSKSAPFWWLDLRGH